MAMTKEQRAKRAAHRADLRNRGFDNVTNADNGNLRVRCSQCQVMVINGLACHETGCPNIPRR